MARRRHRQPPSRIQKKLRHKLQEYDDEHFLLRGNLHSLRDENAHARPLATHLRNLVCNSSGTEGLLWRLVDELSVSDEIELTAYTSVNRDHALNRGLTFWKIPLHRGDQGPPGAPLEMHSLRQIIKESEAIYVPSLQVASLTHEWLIKSVAQQIGSAHVDEGISPALQKILKVSVNGILPLVQVLAFDAELTLQIGERLLDAAAAGGHHARVSRANHGDLSVIVCLRKRDLLAGELRLAAFRSYVSEVDIECVAGPTSVRFLTTKRGVAAGEFALPYRTDWSADEYAVFTFEYSSNNRQVVTMTNTHPTVELPIDCDLGWLEQRELRILVAENGHEDAIKAFFQSALCGVLSSLLPPHIIAEIQRDPHRIDQILHNYNSGGHNT